MPANLLHRLIALGRAAAHGLHRRLLAATRPTTAPLVSVPSSIWHAASLHSWPRMPSSATSSPSCAAASNGRATPRPIVRSW